MTTIQPLSANDLAILGALFDPETSLSSKNNLTISPSQPTSTTTPNTPPPSHLLQAELQILKPLNTPNPSPALLTYAITQLTNLITKNPTYPSLYTNRAQATRLLPNSLTNSSLLHSILSDLNSAISLASSSPSPTTSTTSTSNTLVLSNSHSHRAYILLSASQNPSQFNILTSLDLPTLGLPIPADLTPSKLEDLASRDFEVAARHGDENARKMSVKTNPYAKVCAGIVRQALREEIWGFYEGREL